MPESRRRGVIGFAKQSAKGTAAANPAYTVGVAGGVMAPTREMDDLPYTGDTAQRAGRYVKSARGEGSVSMLAHPDLLGLLLYEICGAQAISGAAVPYTHDFTLTDNVPQTTPMTVWQMLPDAWWRYTDVYMNQLTLSGQSGENIMMEASMMALNARQITTAPTYTLLNPEPRFKYIGSVVKLEADNATPVVVDNVESFELTINRDLELRYGAKLTPTFVIPNRDMDFQAGVLYDTSGSNQGWDYLRMANIGSNALDTDLSQVIGAGSFDVQTGRHPSDVTRFLRVASNGANWEYAVDMPEPDPGGGPVEFDVTGMVKRPTGGGQELSVLRVLNEVAAIY